MFFNNAFARPGMFASQRNNFQVPNAQPQPAPPPRQLPSGYQAQSYQTFSVLPGKENTVMGRTLSPAERGATMSNDMGMPPGYNAPSSSMGIGDLMRRQGAMQAIAAPPMASNQMGMEQPRFYQPPQMMGIMSLLSGLLGGGYGRGMGFQPPPQRPQSVEDVLRSRGFNPPSKPTGMAMTADMSYLGTDPVTGEMITGSGSMRPYHESLRTFYDQNPEALDIAKKYKSDAEERIQQQLANRKTNPFDQLGGAIEEPKAEPVRAVDMFSPPQSLGGFAQPQMGFGGKGGIKGGGMYGRPSYGMQARYSSPFQGFF